MSDQKQSSKRRQAPKGATAAFAAWTPEEDAKLRASFGPGGIAAAARALPDRTTTALYHRARRLGLSRRRRWTPADDAHLRRLWNGGELGLKEIAARLSRTPITTYWRAQRLGLPLGCPEGWEHLTTAAARTGYYPSQLRQVLAADGARIRRPLTRDSKPRGRRRGSRRRLTWIVCSAEVDAAIAAWLETEPVGTAARRIGMGQEALSRRLRAVGLEKPRLGRFHWRVTDEEVAAAAAVRIRPGRVMPIVRGARGRFAAERAGIG